MLPPTPRVVPVGSHEDRCGFTAGRTDEHRGTINGNVWPRAAAWVRLVDALNLTPGHIRSGKDMHLADPVADADGVSADGNTAPEFIARHSIVCHDRGLL